MTPPSASALKISEKASSYKYDKSKYTVVDLKIRRDSETGSLVSRKSKKDK